MSCQRKQSVGYDDLTVNRFIVLERIVWKVLLSENCFVQFPGALFCGSNIQFWYLFCQVRKSEGILPKSSTHWSTLVVNDTIISQLLAEFKQSLQLSSCQTVFRTFPNNYPWKSGKRHDNKETEGKRRGSLKQEHLGVFRSHNNPESIRDTSGTAGTFELCSARPHCISPVEGSTGCLTDARYARCRGRDRN